MFRMLIRAMIDRIENGYPGRAAFGAVAGAGMGVGVGFIWIGALDVPSDPGLVGIFAVLFALIGALIVAGSREVRPRAPDEPPAMLRDLYGKHGGRRVKKRPRIIE